MNNINDVARKRFWRILVDLGDFMECGLRKEEVMESSLEKLLEEAQAMKENHIRAGNHPFNKTAVKRYERFIERFSN